MRWCQHTARLVHFCDALVPICDVLAHLYHADVQSSDALVPTHSTDDQQMEYSFALMILED